MSKLTKTIQMETTSAALSIAISLVVFGISYYYFTSRHKERMEILERGLAPNYFKKQAPTLSIILLLGICSLGIALGIATGYYLSSLYSLEKFITISATVFLGLGIALLITYALLKNIQKSGK